MFSSKRAGWAAGLLALSAGAAAAAPATVTTDLNLRAGPGTDYAVVALLPAGSTVDTRGCGGDGWCRVSFGGYSGFVASSYLDIGGAVYAAPPPPPPVYVERPYYRPYYRPYGFYGRPYYGYGHRHRW